MIDINSTSRIIGDFREINADMFFEKQSVKRFKFIAKLKYNIKHKKLIKMVNKFKESNFILDKNNLVEYIAYVYNNFPPKGEYRSITNCTINDEDGNELEAVLRFTGEEFLSCRAIITIDRRLPKFTATIIVQSLQGVATSCSVNIDRLYSDSKSSKELIEILNKRIHKDMSEYILECLEAYD